MSYSVIMASRKRMTECNRKRLQNEEEIQNRLMNIKCKKDELERHITDFQHSVKRRPTGEIPCKKCQGSRDMKTADADSKRPVISRLSKDARHPKSDCDCDSESKYGRKTMSSDMDDDNHTDDDTTDDRLCLKSRRAPSDISRAGVKRQGVNTKREKCTDSKFICCRKNAPCEGNTQCNVKCKQQLQQHQGTSPGMGKVRHKPPPGAKEKMTETRGSRSETNQSVESSFDAYRKSLVSGDRLKHNEKAGGTCAKCCDTAPCKKQKLKRSDDSSRSKSVARDPQSCSMNRDNMNEKLNKYLRKYSGDRQRNELLEDKCRKICTPYKKCGSEKCQKQPFCVEIDRGTSPAEEHPKRPAKPKRSISLVLEVEVEASLPEEATDTTTDELPAFCKAKLGHDAIPQEDMTCQKACENARKHAEKNKAESSQCSYPCQSRSRSAARERSERHQSVNCNRNNDNIDTSNSYAKRHCRKMEDEKCKKICEAKCSRQVDTDQSSYYCKKTSDTVEGCKKNCSASKRQNTRQAVENSPRSKSLGREPNAPETPVCLAERTLPSTVQDGNRAPDCRSQTTLSHSGPSPIDITSNNLIRKVFPPFVFNDTYARAPSAIMIQLSDQNYKLRFQYGDGVPLPGVSGSLICGCYVLDHCYFKFPSSEHTINSRYFSMEMHAVHVKEGVTYEMALKRTCDLVIIAYMFEGCQTMSCPELTVVADTIRNLARCTGGMCHVDDDCLFAADRLVGKFQDNYVIYRGSITWPPYTPNVSWIVAPFAKPINCEQYRSFVELLRTGTEMSSNKRKLQPAPNRAVYLATRPSGQEGSSEDDPNVIFFGS